MMDGIICVVCFLGGAILSFTISGYYNAKIYEMMKELNRQPRRRKVEDEKEKEAES